LQAQSKFSKAHNELNKLKLKLFKFSFGKYTNINETVLGCRTLSKTLMPNAFWGQNATDRLRIIKVEHQGRRFGGQPPNKLHDIR